MHPTYRVRFFNETALEMVEVYRSQSFGQACGHFISACVQQDQQAITLTQFDGQIERVIITAELWRIQHLTIEVIT